MADRSARTHLTNSPHRADSVVRADNLAKVVDAREVGDLGAPNLLVVEAVEAPLIGETTRHRVVARVALP